MNTLAHTPVGTTVRVSRIESQPETCIRLLELGFCEDAIIRPVVSGSSQMICEICNTRVGLHHSIAKSIIVIPE
ncbi:MAG: FeoA family protein [Bacteroidota bacterium]|jgi:Fe2+ transport system protein FeoA